MSIDSENDKVIKNLGAILPKALDEAILTSFEQVARSIMDDVIKQEGFNNQTFNLEDSYGAGIYKGGVLQKIIWANESPKASEPRRRGEMEFWGHSEAERFFRKYKSDGLSCQYEIVIAAVMYYGKYVENHHLLNVLTDSWLNTKQELKHGGYAVVFKSVSNEVMKKYFK